MKRKTKIKGQYRQGDVLIQRTESNPVGTKCEKGKQILAHGEVTGHAHEIDEAEAWKEGGNVVAITITTPAPVKHQEHGPIPLRRGTHKVIRQREYSPETIRRVAD